MRIEPKFSAHTMLVINGHPDPRPQRFCAAICDAYSRGVRSSGWLTQHVSIGELGYSLFDAASGEAACSRDIERALMLVAGARRLMIAFPLWLDRAPPALEIFLREATRRAHSLGTNSLGPAAKCSRMFVTMQMPAFIYRSRAVAGHSRSLCGPTLHLPVEESEPLTFIGSVNSLSADQRAIWLEKVRSFGEHDC